MAKTATKTRTKSSTKTSAKAKARPAKTTTTKSKSKVTKKTTKAKSVASKTKAETADESVDSLVMLDETGNRQVAERREETEKVVVKRRKSVRRRRQIDPTTCERDYSDQEIQFMHAMDEYKQLSGRMFPTCSEILEVITKLGYRQIADAQVVYDPNADDSSANSDESLDDEGDDFESCV